MYGEGTVIAIGGDAGDGGGAVSGNTGGRRRSDGAGARNRTEIGGNGGNANSFYSSVVGSQVVQNDEDHINRSGKNGGAGENCGIVNIKGKVILYAYGGKGGSAGGGSSGNSGTGGGGYPGARNWPEVELAVAGGSHANGGGGYSGGAGEGLFTYSYNGKGGVSTSWSAGGGYFSSGNVGTGSRIDNPSSIGGQGGGACGGMPYDLFDSAGDGGIAGIGGVITYSSDAILYAYNGNKYTDETSYNEGKNQLEIFAQNGELREVYKYNSWWGKLDDYKYDYFTKLFGNSVNNAISSVSKATGIADIENVLVRESKTCELSGYTNPITSNTQGIGSGAGYIELDNGTYIIDSNLN